MSETTAEIRKLASEVIEGGIIAKAAERLVYQIVEVCAEHEKAALAAVRAEEREACAKVADDVTDWHETHLMESGYDEYRHSRLDIAKSIASAIRAQAAKDKAT